MTDKDDITLKTPAVNVGGPIASLDRQRRQGAKRKAGSMTDAERRLLLAEIAALSAELGELQAWTADIARRVTSPRSTRTERSA